jgi:hypothetical protein
LSPSEVGYNVPINNGELQHIHLHASNLRKFEHTGYEKKKLKE